MIDKTGGIPPQLPPHDHQPAKGKSTQKAAGAKSASPHEKEGGTSKFLGMEVTEKQKKQIYANLSKQIITSIKHDQDRQVKALKNLRHAEEGEPLDP